MPLEGGHLALDFVNTIGGLRDDPPVPDEELLDRYEDVTSGALRLGVISEREAGVAASRGRP